MRLLQDSIRSLVRLTQPEGYKGDGSRYYRCPFCGGRKKLEVDSRKPVWFCHKCGIGGALDEQRRGSWERTNRINTIEPVTFNHLISAFKPCTPDTLLWKYLSKERRLSTSTIRSLRPYHGPSPVRVYFPFYELGGTKPIYFIGRSILPCFPRYWNPSLEDFQHRKSTVLWGLHRFRQPVPQVVICEGTFSACHEPNRVAILGKTISEEQVNILKQICTEELIVCLDGGERHSSIKFASCIGVNTCLKVSIVHLPKGKDPDDLRDITPWLKTRERFA